MNSARDETYLPVDKSHRNLAEVQEFCQLGSFKVAIPPGGYGETIDAALKRGSYEAAERGILPHILKPGDRVLEVGGAIGAVSMTCAQVLGDENVLSFEANPRLVENARTNFELNELLVDARIGVLQCRLNWTPGTSLPFYIHKNFWASSLNPLPGTIGTIAAETFCLEDEAAKFGANVLVCDIEGGEIDLLTSADLSNFDRILMEIHYWAGREAINKLIRKLIIDGFMVNFEQCRGPSVVTFHRGLLP